MADLKKKVWFIFSLIFLSLILLFPRTTNAQNILFEDDFEGGNFNQWQITHGSWQIASDPSFPENGNWVTVNNPAYTDTEIQAGNFAWTNYLLSFDILPKSGIDRNVFFRVNNLRTGILIGHDLPVSYSLQLKNNPYLGKWTLTTMPPLPGGSGSVPLNTKSHVDIRLEGGNIQVYLNSVLIVDYTDTNNPLLNGRIALGSITGSSASEVWYDNVLVTELASEPPAPELPNFDVPDVKQFSLPWGPLIYDTADLWSSDPTIAKWGCALTSASMILQYYNHNINPDALNNWLNSQVDGYLRNGLVNWLAISRFSKINANTESPALEYNRIRGSDPANLIAELEAGRPAILEEPGHFVVAKSQTPDSYGINDPAYPERITLADYADTFRSIGSYTPSQTDLSYIFLVTDPNINISVFDPDGNLIESNSYTLDPIHEAGGSGVSGEALNAFSFPKPPDGQYQVELTGNGQYTLESYLYDPNGQVNKSTFSGLIAPEQTDGFTIDIVGDGGNSQTNADLGIDSLIEDLDNANNLGLISKPKIYSLLRRHLILARGMAQRGKTGAARGLLTTFYWALRAFTPKYIAPEASNILQAETLELLNNL